MSIRVARAKPPESIGFGRIHSNLDLAGLEIDQFSRSYPCPDGTSPDAVATMRDVAMILAAANLKPEDLAA